MTAQFSQMLFQQKSQMKIPHNITFERIYMEEFFYDSLDLVYPGMLRKQYIHSDELEKSISNYLNKFTNIIKSVEIIKERVDSVSSLVKKFSDKILEINLKLEEDAKALLDGDPAAKSLTEVLLCYPGIFAIAAYRIAHFFYQEEIPVLPRLFSEIAHEKTGIDIHPGAKIGDSFLIDHGTGVVIGETAVIGNHVKIYQGVTLGALSVEKKLADMKRHPTIKDHCVIYSHATILGGETIIGEHSVIGGNVWITKSVPAYSMVYHKSEVKLAVRDKNANNNQIDKQEELTYDI